MTAPLDLDALEAAALAATPEPVNWWQLYPQKDFSEDEPILGATYGDYCHIVAASPAVVLALIERLRGVDKLLAIIGAFYQICAEHDFPEHLLDILSDPEAATPEQVDALLPYVLPDDEPAVQIVEPIIRTKDEWTEIALAQGHGPQWVEHMLSLQQHAQEVFDLRMFGNPLAEPTHFLGLSNTEVPHAHS